MSYQQLICVVNDIHTHDVQLYLIQFFNLYVRQCGKSMILAIVLAADIEHINPHTPGIWHSLSVF